MSPMHPLRIGILAMAMIGCAFLTTYSVRAQGIGSQVPLNSTTLHGLELYGETVESPLRGPLPLGHEVHFVSLFWPPYVGPSLPEGGIDTILLTKVFADAGLRLKVSYMPWSRALALFDSGAVDGIYPEYPERGTADPRCLLSAPYRHTLLSLIEHKDKPLEWQKVRDLGRYHLGVVQDYVNTPEFDFLAQEGSLAVEEETTDIANLRKVAAKRIDGAVIDPQVFAYLTHTDSSLASLLNDLQLNARPLGRRTLHVCFIDTPRGTALREVFHDYLPAYTGPVPTLQQAR